MSAIATALRELWGLFVEDASFTVGILAVLGLAMFVVPRLGVSGSWKGPLVFLALAIILVENVVRSARS